jgi:hypothetical protein
VTVSTKGIGSFRPEPYLIRKRRSGPIGVSQSAQKSGSHCSTACGAFLVCRQQRSRRDSRTLGKRHRKRWAASRVSVAKGWIRPLSRAPPCPGPNWTSRAPPARRAAVLALEPLRVENRATDLHRRDTGQPATGRASRHGAGAGGEAPKALRMRASGRRNGKTGPPRGGSHPAQRAKRPCSARTHHALIRFRPQCC